MKKMTCHATRLKLLLQSKAKLAKAVADKALAKCFDLKARA